MKCACTNGGVCRATDGHCTCPPGFIGATCEHTCLSGYHGDGCVERCACINGEGCDAVTGVCECKPGWQGDRCEQGSIIFVVFIIIIFEIFYVLFLIFVVLFTIFIVIISIVIIIIFVIFFIIIIITISIIFFFIFFTASTFSPPFTTRKFNFITLISLYLTLTITLPPLPSFHHHYHPPLPSPPLPLSPSPQNVLPAFTERCVQSDVRANLLRCVTSRQVYARVRLVGVVTNATKGAPTSRTDSCARTRARVSTHVDVMTSRGVATVCLVTTDNIASMVRDCCCCF